MNADEKCSTVERVAIVGAGSIGRAFALVFADAGHEVRLCEADDGTRNEALDRIAESIADLRAFDLCEGDADTIISRISVSGDLGEAVNNAAYVQECVPEDLEIKRKVFADLCSLAPGSAVLASSSSALLASQIAAGLENAQRCLVAHPGNPPTLIRVVEVVPARFTSADCVERTCAILRSVGLRPVVVKREVAGFVFNRLQGAVLREAYCLVRDGVAGVEDIDTIVRDGLGLRWAVVGPFETADLNRRGGIGAHARIMGGAYEAMGAERGQHDPWTPELVATIEAERRSHLALEDWDDRVRWRDREIMKLLASRRD
mgnify:CR=1 FL=1